MARKTRRSSEKNDGQDLEMEKFMKDLSENTVIITGKTFPA